MATEDIILFKQKKEKEGTAIAKKRTVRLSLLSLQSFCNPALQLYCNAIKDVSVIQ